MENSKHSLLAFSITVFLQYHRRHVNPLSTYEQKQSQYADVTCDTQWFAVTLQPMCKQYIKLQIPSSYYHKSICHILLHVPETAPGTSRTTDTSTESICRILFHVPQTAPGTSRTTDTSTDSTCPVLLNVPHTAPDTSRIINLSPATMHFITSTADSDGDEHVDGSGKDSYYNMNCKS